jgi:peptidoglycan hydrolase-like protein with peptidoglycan-binding domain
MKRLVLATVSALALLVGVFTLQSSAQAAEWPTAQNGDSGVTVQALQHLLTAGGSATEADGAFGPNTEAAVQSFQTANGLEATGVVDAATWEALATDVQVGSTGDAVSAAQTLVNKFVGPITVDGEFGEGTDGAIRAFQASHGLEETGVVNVDTWRELVGNAGVAYSLPLPRDSQPRDEWDDPHHDYPALDMQTPEGTDVFATQAGSATTIVEDGGCGIGVIVNGADGAEYTYCHMSAHVIAGGEVQAGQKIGESGNTGSSTGPHLHVQIDTGDLRCPGPMMLAIYDGTTVPAPTELPTSGCSN